MLIESGVQFGGGVCFVYDIPAMPDLVTTGLQVNLFTAPSSGTIWIDASGNGRNATLQGTPTYVSNNGGGIKLNNINSSAGTDYISVPYNISSTTLTVEVVASFNPTSFWASIWANELYNESRGYWAVMLNSTVITYGKTLGATTETITASNAIRQWIFVVDNTQHSLYLNGTQVGTTDTLTAQTLFTSTNLYFGARHQNGGTGAADKMNNSTAANQPVFYQMRVYNTALSAADVTQNYNAVKDIYGI